MLIPMAVAVLYLPPSVFCLPSVGLSQRFATTDGETKCIDFIMFESLMSGLFVWFCVCSLTVTWRLYQ